jgi:hypothetical protein
MRGSALSSQWTAQNGCPTGKRAYVNRRAAKQAASRNRRMGNDRLSVYKCKQCFGWHLGHLPREVKRGIMDRHDIIPKPNK